MMKQYGYARDFKDTYTANNIAKTSPGQLNTSTKAPADYNEPQQFQTQQIGSSLSRYQ